MEQINDPYTGPDNNMHDSGGQPVYMRPVQGQINSMSTAAAVLGVTAAASTMVLPVYLPCILGSLAIVMALLSRGSALMALRARIGLTVALVSIIMNIMMLASGVYMFVTVPEVRQQFYDFYEQIYGESPEEYFGAMFR